MNKQQNVGHFYQNKSWQSQKYGSLQMVFDTSPYGNRTVEENIETVVRNWD